MRKLIFILLAFVSIAAYGQKKQTIKQLVVTDSCTIKAGDPAANKIAVSMDGNGRLMWVYFSDFQDSINQGVFDTLVVDSISGRTGIFDTLAVRGGGTFVADSAHIAAIGNGGVIGRCSVRCEDVRWTTVDGTQTVLKDSTDNVGIGTSNPTAKLHVDFNGTNGFKVSNSTGARFEVTDNEYILENPVGDILVSVAGGTHTYTGDFNGTIEGVYTLTIGNDATETIDGIYTKIYNNDVSTSIGGANTVLYSSTNEQTFGGLSTYNYIGGLKITGIGEADGYVLTSDTDGNATWQDPSCITGWESIQDTSNSWVIAAGDTQTILIERDIVINSQLPCGIDSLYNSLDSTIIGFDGDAYVVTLDWVTTQNTNNATEFKFWFNLGGVIGKIYMTTYDQNKGVGQSKPYNKTTAVYNGATWESNGGKIQFTTDQDITIDDVRINIHRIHKAR